MRALEIILAISSLALAATVAAELRDGGASGDVALAQPQARSPQPANAPARSDDELETAILARPLFTPARRPPVPASRADAPTAAATIPVPTWDWRLAGIVIKPDGRDAMFARPGEMRTLAEGQLIADWIVTSVTLNSVTLKNRDAVKTLHPEPRTAAEGEPTKASTALDTAARKPKSPAVAQAEFARQREAFVSALTQKLGHPLSLPLAPLGGK